MSDTIRDKAKTWWDSPDFPKFKAFFDKAEETSKTQGQEVLRALHGHFVDVLRSDEVAKLLNNELRNLHSNPLRRAAAFSNKSFTIYQNNAIALSCVLFDHKLESELISSMYSPFVGGVLSKDGMLSIRRFVLPPSWKDDVYDPATVAQFVGEFGYQHGEAFSVDSPFDLVDFSAEKPLMLLRMATKQTSRFTWLFDKKNIAPLFFSSVTAGATRYETLIKVIRELYQAGDQKSQSLLEVLRFLTNHSLHNVRWMSTQVLFQLSAEDGIVALRKAANDEHPHIRAAAANSLEKLHNMGMLA